MRAKHETRNGNFNTGEEKNVINHTNMSLFSPPNKRKAHKTNTAMINLPLKCLQTHLEHLKTTLGKNFKKPLVEILLLWRRVCKHLYQVVRGTTTMEMSEIPKISRLLVSEIPSIPKFRVFLSSTRSLKLLYNFYLISVIARG